ncbi:MULTISPECIES: DUF397 domain-containing protein [Streptomyces]|uniref:DUF397 domain-containing protein n=1 Tax=Streptomyces morookaense TaxID=1970 RepID=A0A7Y7B391_STRMO|nr:MULTISPECIES: DUF397 domain-containing protein [Streptomyces]MCC2279564.1 DUF397 domain-containing protein [Streptomyces sp. ET3-23]NVK78070.1 DUF397 domain-containing protein [Streptomyces morookaense]GHF15939.1 hypothetical protein GCM10010359_16740 [Streptomyces morookaense]
MSTTPTEWVKSSFSNANGDGCLEWSPARIPTAPVPIRDSKTAPNGATLHVPPTAWAAFVTAVRTAAL